MKASLALWCLLGASSVALPAEMERPKLHVDKSVYTLHPFTGVYADGQHCGVYKFREEPAGGTALHLFPNGRFVIVKFMDAANDELLGAGTHRIDGDHLELRFERSARADVPKQFADLHIQYGRIERAGLVEGFAAFVIGKEAWHALLQGETEARYRIRTREYIDWQKKLEKLEALSTGASPAATMPR